jgi:predicted Zn-dependent protease
MKVFYSILIVIVSLLISGCAEVTQVAGDIVSQQEYDKTFKKEYQKARASGMTHEQAQAYAEKIAQAEAASKKQIFEGAGDIITSATDIDYESERAIGESLALQGIQRYGMPLSNDSLQRYVNLVGNAVARNSIRSNIPYNFVVLNSPLYNAFSCPGGIIFISSALVNLMEDESQLANVLAHEVAHVSHKHALSSIKRARFFEGVGKVSTANMKGEKGVQYQQMIGDLQTVLFDRGLDKSMEFEADVSAMETAYRTGYDPASMIRVLELLRTREASAQKAGSWYSTHPPLSSRIQRCQSEMYKYPDASSMATLRERFLQYR